MPVGAFEERTALVTGGTDGIGREVARALARRGVKTFIVGRDQRKGQAAETELRTCSPNGEVYFVPADLSLRNETLRLAGEVSARCKSLNYLVHGAGIVMGRRVLTADGVESNFAVNFLSRFLLTQRLLALLQRAGTMDLASRIVILGGAATSGKIFFDDVNLTNNFGILNVVGQFCRANDAFTVELARRLASSRGTPHVTITCLKIGVVKTNIRRTFPLWMRILVPLIADPLLGQKPADVAASAVRLLFDSEFEGLSGALFLQVRKFKRLELDSILRDPRIGERLWELGERMSPSPQLQSVR
jgi:NAD(P)-dependent dehydrogenase (short-subunit alcohol dehydrogenase family)